MLAGASTDQVAAAAGFTRGAVYSNFGSKDDLFLALVDAEVAARVAAVEQELAGTTDLPGARTAFVAYRRDLRARVAGWDAGSLTLVLIALTNGLALEALPDPAAVPDDVLPRVLADLLQTGR